MKKLVFAFLLMGFTSLVIQVLLIREFLICFYGNELTIGLILANWIILGAVGSGLASGFSQRSKKPLLSYSILQSLIAVYLSFAVYLIRGLKSFLPLSSGEMVGLAGVFGSSFLILSGLGILVGAEFPLGCRIWKDYSQNNIESVSRVYILESLGFIIAGPVFTYIFITRLASLEIAATVGLLNLISAILILQKETESLSKKFLTFIIAILICVGAISLFPAISQKLNDYSLKKQWKNYTLLESKNSIYANISVTKEKEQYTFFSDGIPIITTPVPDIIATEEFTHFAMLSHPDPKDILVAGGGAGGVIFEILKYPVRRIDYTELDPLLIRLIKKYPTPLTQKELSDARVSVKIIDAGLYIKNTPQRYDVVLIKLPLPATLQLNRFYTKEFFGTVKGVLKDSGILVFSLAGSLSYLSPELQKLNLSTINTLKEVFGFIKVIPGDSNIYLASNSAFNIEPDLISQRLKERNISSRVFTPFYIQERLDRRWSDWFYNTLSKNKNVKNNSAFLPVGLFYSLSYWDMLSSPYLSGFLKTVEKINLKMLLLIVFAAAIFIFSLGRKFKKIGVAYALLTSGMLGIVYELLLVFVYQSFYGYVYQHLALLITSFMVGLTLGGWLMTRYKSIAKINPFDAPRASARGLLRVDTEPRLSGERINFMLLEAGLIIFSVAIIPLLTYLEKSLINLSFIFFMLAAIPGFFVGAEFPLANKLYRAGDLTKTAGILYALDLAGSWAGALITAVVLIPAIGIIQTCLLLAAIKLSSLILISTLKG